MQNINLSDYGLWSLVFINSAIFILFAYSFTKLKTKRNWKSFGLFSAFIVAYFTEMYGFPLTIYLLSGWLSQYYPGVNLYSHDSGHLFHTLFGLKGNPHFDIFHITSIILVVLGLVITSQAWGILYKAQKTNTLATTGPYSYVRHPQYLGFILIMFGFILQWPTLITLIMFPILITIYVRLAYREEKETTKEFGEEYKKYAEDTPMFIPRLSKLKDSI